MAQQEGSEFEPFGWGLFVWSWHVLHVPAFVQHSDTFKRCGPHPNRSTPSCLHLKWDSISNSCKAQSVGQTVTTSILFRHIIRELKITKDFHVWKDIAQY